MIYAMCFVGFMTCVMIFIFIEYRSRIYMLKDDMETNLHIVENYCITVNQKTDSSQDTFERERERAHIITVGVNNSSATNSERIAQAHEIGRAFSSEFKNLFHLDGKYPKSGLLLLLSKSQDNKSTMTIKEVTIYEPTYLMGEVFPVYCNNNTHDHTDACKNKAIWGRTEPTGFMTTQTTTGWYTYKLYFDDDNNYAEHCQIIEQSTAPMLSTGVPAEGATIEATIVATFYQPDNFVVGPVVMHTVEVHEAIDIVYASEDSRKQ